MAACSGSVEPASSAVQAKTAAAIGPYRPTSTFQEIMDSVVDQSSDVVWKSVSTRADATGVHEFKPKTDAEWFEVRRRAVILVEAANLIDVPGRRVANGDKSVEEKATLDVAQIQQRLDTQHQVLVGFSDALRDVSVKLLDAIDRRDTAAIGDLGGTLDEVCEDCHKVFWYPDPVPAATGKP
jgi:hypothetical protein